MQNLAEELKGSSSARMAESARALTIAMNNGFDSLESALDRLLEDKLERKEQRTGVRAMDETTGGGGGGAYERGKRQHANKRPFNLLILFISFVSSRSGNRPS